MTIYINSDYRCYTQPGEGLRAVACDWADGKCAAYIEGMRYIPQGETWTRADGAVFTGEAVCAAQDAAALLAVQAAYEQQQATQRVTDTQLAVAESYETMQDELTALRLALAEIYESMEV